jgi:hypothetical protein
MHAAVHGWRADGTQDVNGWASLPCVLWDGLAATMIWLLSSSLSFPKIISAHSDGAVRKELAR